MNGVADASWVAIVADVGAGAALVTAVLVVGIAVGTEVGGAEVGAPRLIAIKRKNSRRDIFFMVVSPEPSKYLQPVYLLFGLNTTGRSQG